MKIFTETPRFLLREIVEADAEGMFLLDSDAEVHKYLGNHPIQSLDEAQDIITYIRNQYQENGIGRWAVIDKQDDTFIGWSGLKYETVVRPGQPYYDLGYRFRREYWGKGVATETALASLAYGFEIMQLSQICAGAHVENIGSNRVLQKVGMLQKEPFIYDGEPHNWYTLDKQDWQGINPV